MVYPTRNKAYSTRNRARSGFYQAKVTKVEESEGAFAGVSIYCPRIGINPPMSVGPYPNVGPVPSVGDTVWISFVEGKQDDLIVFNPQATTFSWDVDTLVVNTTDDAVLFNTATAVLDDGGTEYYPVVIQAKDSLAPAVKIIPGSTVNTTRATMMFHKTIMGAGSAVDAEGDWYVYDNDNSKYNLHHSGHDNVVNGGLTVRATGTHTQGTAGTFERAIQFAPTYDWGGYERGAFFIDNQYTDFTFFGSMYQYSCHPAGNNAYSLGYNGGRWSEVFAVNGTINTSDQNQKTNIADCDLGLEFVKSVRPVKFKWIETEGRPGVRTHYGLLGQEVETVLGGAASDTAIWTNALIEAHPAMAGDPERNVIAVPAVEEHYEQGLRYTELISPIIKAIQEINVQLEGNAFQSQSAVDYIADFDAKMLAKQPQADQDRADIADLKTRVAALEA